MLRFVRALLFGIVAAAALTAPAGATFGNGSIQHVIVIIQENRSFDNLFQFLPGADTQSYGVVSSGQHIPLIEQPLVLQNDLPHSFSAFRNDYNGGQNNGWDLSGCGCPERTFSYVKKSDVQAYYNMAQAYSIADENTQTNRGPSMPAHQYLIAGQSGTPLARDGNSGGCVAGDNVEAVDLRTPYPGTTSTQSACQDYTTFLDSMTTAGKTWKYYANSTTGFWVPTSYITHLDTSPNLIVPETTLLTDIQAGTIPNFVEVTPSNANSDHPSQGGGGPAWVTSIVNAVGQSSLWSSTAVVVVWDDWGGFYDHVVPITPLARPLDPYEYGYRTPLIVISPFAKRGFISHKRRDFTAILHMAESVFGTPSLGQMDQYADDLSDMFDFTQTARQFVPFNSGTYIQWEEIKGHDSLPIDSE